MSITAVYVPSSFSFEVVKYVHVSSGYTTVPATFVGSACAASFEIIVAFPVTFAAAPSPTFICPISSSAEIVNVTSPFVFAKGE